jgi:hypothetical protein
MRGVILVRMASAAGVLVTLATVVPAGTKWWR